MIKRPASADPMEAWVKTSPFGLRAKAPLDSALLASGMSWVMMISKGSAASAIQSSAASGDCSTKTKRTPAGVRR